MPDISVIIPTYNRPRQLKGCLTSFLGVVYPRDRFEVIVIDDGSPAALDGVVAPFKDHYTIRLIRQPNAGPAAARNAGAAAAAGKFIAFTDDDCAPVAGWLEALTQALTADERALVGGPVINALPRDIYAGASQLLVAYLYSYYNRDGRQATFFTSNNFAMRADAFREMNGFDSAYTRAAAEDRDFCDRWHGQGRPMAYVPEAQILHTHHMTLRKFVRQHWQYGLGAFQFHQARARRNETAMGVEPFSFYSNLLLYPFHAADTARPGVASALMFISQAANAAGYFWAAGQDRLSRG